MATPVFDAVSSGGSASTVLLTISHTCTTNGNRALWVWTYARDLGAGDVTGVTYNAVAMTQIGTTQTDDNNDLKCWELVAPATGANDIVIVISGLRPIAACAQSYYDVDQATPSGSVNQGAELSRTVTISDTQLLLMGIGIEDSTEPSPPQFSATGTNQTERVEAHSGGRLYIACSDQTGNGSVTSTFSFTGAEELMGSIAFPINVVSASGSGRLVNGCLVNGLLAGSLA